MWRQEVSKNLGEVSQPEGTKSLAALCKAASEPIRLDIMRVLSRDSFGVQELASILSVPQPGMSHHLKILSQCGLLKTRRQGNSIFYRRAMLRGDGEFDAFQASLYATLDENPLNETYLQRMAAVHQERSEQSQEYFKKNADKFQERQGMLCDLSQYLSNLRELLELMRLPKKSRVMEVGPGQGGLLKELSQRCDSLVALDSASEILELTKKSVSNSSRKIEFVNCSLEAYSSGEKSFDAVILNMVMHHLASPAQAFLKLKQLLKPGGYVLVADLCSHHQEWVKTVCGDLWLGFDPQELSDWALKAGLETKQSLYLGLKNGFQIQLKLFKERTNAHDKA